MAHDAQQAQYDAMWQRGAPSLARGDAQLDPAILADNDRRRGISLILQPSAAQLSRLTAFQHEAAEIEPGLYCYPTADLHVTVLSLFSCADDFALAEVDIPDYVDLVAACLSSKPKLRLRFMGVTATPECVMAQGFADDDALNVLRERIRKLLRVRSLPTTVDSRYVSTTAHCTVLRFPRPLAHAARFVRFLAAHRSTDFGTADVTGLSLVYNDWYHRRQNVQLLQRFSDLATTN